VETGAIDFCSIGQTSGSTRAISDNACAWRSASGVVGLPVTGPNAMRMFIATHEEGGSLRFGPGVGSHFSASRRTCELRYSVMISGQFAIWALICLMIGAPGAPADAVFTERGEFSARVY